MSRVDEIRWRLRSRPGALALVVLAVLLVVVGAVLTIPQAQNGTSTPAPLETSSLDWDRPGALQEAQLPLVRDDTAPSGTAPTPQGLDAAGIDLHVKAVPVGLNADGSAQVPSDPSDVGWYQPLGAPDGVGSDVLVGHVSYRGVPGAFARLHELRVGDPLTLDLGSAVTQYRVTSADAYPKDLTPLEDLYDPNGPARLVLITCGGEFSTLVGHYDENIVVTAVPA